MMKLVQRLASKIQLAADGMRRPKRSEEPEDENKVPPSPPPPPSKRLTAITTANKVKTKDAMSHRMGCLAPVQSHG